MRPVATLASAGAPWLLPMLGIGLFLHKHFICHDSSPADARAKAVARAKAAAPPKIKRKALKQDATASSVPDHVTLEDQEQQLADAVMGQAWFTEDEVEALHQAEANPQALLDLLQQYGGRMVAEGLLEEGGSDDDDDSMWYTDDPDNSWQHDSPSPDSSRQLQAQPRLLVTRLQADGTNSRPGSPDPSGNNTQQQQEAAAVAGHEFVAQLAAAVQQQRQEQGDAASQGSDASDAAAAAYFDNSYFGLPTDASAAPKDLQELQVAVSKNLEALLPRDGTWTGSSYPPRFDEMLSPYAARLEPPEPDFDLDLDPGFDYVPDFDFDPEFDDDMFDFDVDFEA